MNSKIILDSISENDDRILTYEVVLNKSLLAQFNTHKMLSKNVSSSRAIPTSKLIDNVVVNPAEILWWGKNQSGMVANDELPLEEKIEAVKLWNEIKAINIEYAKKFAEIKVHKQITNRILEPYSQATIICTGTDWLNFFALRCKPDAQPEIRDLAMRMLRDFYTSEPQLLKPGQYHLPYLVENDFNEDLETQLKVSVARCARVSYLTHNGTRELDKDIELYTRLLESGHMSPFEHQATPKETGDRSYSGNLKGWVQFRKTLVNENKSVIPSLEEVETYFTTKPN